MTPTSPRRSWLRRVLLLNLAGAAVLVIALALRTLYSFRDRNPGYTVDLAIDGRKAAAAADQFRVGFGRKPINPNLSDPGRPVWVAGFSNGRAATRLHDDLWTVATVLDDGRTRLGIVALDAIGFFHDDVIAVRRRLAAAWKLDYVIVCSTHNHSTPDLMGLWGKNLLHTGVDPGYRRHVIEETATAIGDAVGNLQPARLSLFEIPTPPAGLVEDSRDPQVFDPDLRLMLFTHPTNGQTLGSLVTWANHPETPWGKNTELTADFPGYLREALEQGIRSEGKVLAPGLGGVHLYINGAIGGLMTPAPSVTIHDPYLNLDFAPPSHDKARALGRNLAQRILQRVSASRPAPEEHPTISLEAKTIELPVANRNFLLAPILGLLDRGQVRWKTMRSEIALVTIGAATILTIPGEIYPELVNGGVVKAPGGDFQIEPLEAPPLRQLLPGGVKFIFGLANDEVGYIIPKSEWDQKPPYLYNSAKRVYGEVNSLGPDTARLIHQAARDLIQRQASRR